MAVYFHGECAGLVPLPSPSPSRVNVITQHTFVEGPPGGLSFDSTSVLGAQHLAGPALCPGGPIAPAALSPCPGGPVALAALSLCVLGVL